MKLEEGKAPVKKPSDRQVWHSNNGNCSPLGETLN